ncbi:hypothetical protein P154DRAFT_617577 [Amniculicola lignicola CBS 123094]|uniref:Small ribosomal subunit protein mS35 mitochondrial conserved domain-containing protein n=1 Tax=Amniculicola lignicola CBS 123094 TaxID=1392246 RepID=A0A6A5WX50_9PLEO|nr:hypothetical protein P154DRAFT_617577 [Amniculicola lignicola CBS 123094]
MASISRRLLLSSSRCPSRISSPSVTARCTAQWIRPLSSTATRYEDAKPPSAKAGKPEKEKRKRGPRSPKNLAARRERFQSQGAEALTSGLRELNPENIDEAIRTGKRGMQFQDSYELRTDEDFEIVEDKSFKSGFWAEGEESLGSDEDYYADDLTSLGHGELEQHRELRHYARLAAWELPLLHDLARPFELPTAATPFRFRYTSYLGERHPAANKVVVEFSPTDIPSLTTPQKSKLIKLAGPRYNPSTDIIKMSCELHTTLPQNKRFLAETIKALLDEVKNGKDSFADVPFDFRHHKPKKRFEFPQEWVLTDERKKYLEEKRKETLKLDDERRQNGELVDGVKVIEMALPYLSPAAAEPVMIAAGGKGRR